MFRDPIFTNIRAKRHKLLNQNKAQKLLKFDYYTTHSYSLSGKCQKMYIKHTNV